jgi:hypothetical protein
MKYDIYFHNDFDGRASAAVMLAFLRSRGDVIERFTAIDYDLQKDWLDDRFFKKHKLFKGKRNPAIVVDFSYHPGATWWFDHHESPFKKEIWKKKFKPSKFRQYGPKYWSACHFVEAVLRRDFGWKPPAHFKELVKWLDIIDGARYASVKQTLVIKDAALEIDLFIDETHRDRKNTVWMVDLLSRKSFQEIARLPKVKRAAARAKKDIAKSLAWYKKNVKPIGTVSFVDIQRIRFKPLRFAPYYVYPKTRYAVRLGWKGSLHHVGVGFNPWIRSGNTINIGTLLKRYGGGGHRDVGAVDFKKRTDAERAVNEIIGILNHKK